jgi:hypothetical protein
MKYRRSLALFSLALLAGASIALADGDYIGAAKCKMCHKVQFTSWEGLAHAKAFERLEPEEQGDAECLKCHATGANAELPGVQCEACHGAGSDYKSIKIMKEQGASLAAGLLVPDQKTCESCHVGAPHDQKAFDYESAKAGGIHEFKNPR